MKLDKFVENGYIIIDDFLPLDVAHQLESMFTEHENWELLDQVREKHYGEFNGEVASKIYERGFIVPTHPFLNMEDIDFISGVCNET